MHPRDRLNDSSAIAPAEPLRICIVGKYPPIEGGVSATTYWIARGLAAQGHHIHVVTNADEVEGRYRMRLDAGDAEMLQPYFDNGGHVQVHHVESFHARSMFHIPLANPFVTRLASLAIEVVRQYQCQAIVAYYFEPYGVAGWFAANRCNVPLLLKHAGSDLDCLAQVPDLGRVYKEIACDAAAILTGPILARRFAGMGVNPSRIVHNPIYFHDSHFFRPQGPVLDIDATAIHNGAGGPMRRQDPGLPTIGIYGKAGVVKGTFDLIAALGRIAADGRSFRFAAMVGAEFGASMRSSLMNAGIAAHTAILPYLPNWRVPEFIRACNAVCFLERDFPVAIHGPTIPREVLACGTPLVLSKEIADKQIYRDQLASNINVFMITDPRDIDELSTTLCTIIDNPKRAGLIGHAGTELVAEPEGYERFLLAWEELLKQHTRPGTDQISLPPSEACRSALEMAVPDLLAYVQKMAPALVADFLRTGGDPNLPSCALDFCRHLADKLPAALAEASRPVLAEALRYMAARVRAGFDVPGDPPPFPVVDDLHNPTFSLDDVAELYPVRGNSAIVEEFAYDVCHAFVRTGTIDEDADPLTRIQKQSRLVLFQRTANLARCELDIGPGTVALLEACDGRRTTQQVIDAVRSSYPDDDRIVIQVLGALRSLYERGLVVFGRQDPAWGWHKGARSEPAALPPLRAAAASSVALQTR